MTPTETHKKLKLTEAHRNVSRAMVFKWHKRYTDGYEETKQEKRGRPKEIDDNVLEIINDTIRDDRRRTVREMEEMFGTGKSSIHRILSENLRMQRVCARWVPRRLKEEEKQRRVLCSREFLRRVRSGRENFLDRIITTDDPEGKQASSVWKTPGTPPPKKAKVSKSVDKARTRLTRIQQNKSPTIQSRLGTDGFCSVPLSED
ncbi:protein GVQW3-like [Crassostrea angulata]|uniref:protein GVQW3-like n=1 Tax=Magallana angulata TaxID=2784310 RepID=UPI0022B12795|nr:protein GVQW3-like [Crassostrea angulata]